MTWCDWCGEDFAAGEQHVPGYDGKPTHNRCKRAALKSQHIDRGGLVEERFEFDREPFNDWPNGQGTYD